MTSPVHGPRASCFDPHAPGPPECDYEPPALAPTPRYAARLRAEGLRFCREADSVAEGFLCNEPTVVSNACRKPHNAFDAYVCDEPRMHALQNGVLRETFSFLKSMLLGLLRR
jgi:hypothetical protein